MDNEQTTIPKSVAQRALDAQYDAERLSSCLSAAYWLASCHEEQAEYMSVNRMEEAEERLTAIAAALGYRIEKIAAVEQHRETEAA